jgi:plasmid stabilization system protein ParE
MAYTVEQWGAHQRDIYAEKLLAGFDTIAHYPEIGDDRSDIAPGVFFPPHRAARCLLPLYLRPIARAALAA